MPLKSDLTFDKYQKAVYDGTNPTSFPEYLIPSDALDILTEPKENWETRFAAGGKSAKTTRSQLQTEQKDAARVAYEPLFSSFVLSYVKNNPKIPVDAKIAMYIHIDSRTRKKTVSPNSVPIIFKKNTNVSHHVEVFYKDSEAANGHAKPHATDVCQLYVFIIEKDKDGHDVLPLSIDDYWFAGDSSDYHKSLKFEMKDGGKEVLILPRWKNKEGEGSFGPETSATIPR